MSDELDKLTAASAHLPDLRPVKILSLGRGVAAQFVYEPIGGGYQKWFTSPTFNSIDELVDSLVRLLEDQTMTNIFKMTGDLFKFLTAEMIPNGGNLVTMTIKDVEEVELENQRGKQWRAVIRFKETDKGFVLGNKTNVRQMVKLLGPETDDWIGKRISLYRTEIQAFGKMQPVIRIADRLPAQQKAAATPDGGKREAKAKPVATTGPSWDELDEEELPPVSELPTTAEQLPFDEPLEDEPGGGMSAYQD